MSQDRPGWTGPVGALGLLAAGLVISVGTFWAFDRNAPDFSVFYGAWRLVLQGRGADIYRVSTDRFLYAPGFAWLLAWLGWLPRWWALALWCFAKAVAVGYVVREFQPTRRWGLASLGCAAWGVVLLARPLLIDFQYGQVNTLILGACCWAVLGHFRRGEGGPEDLVRWCLVAVAALSKIFPLPLLAIPWVLRAQVPRSRLAWERAGVGVGLLAVLVVPVFWMGWSGTLELLEGWRAALISRGLPFESHNQSFAALLHRWFSGELVHVVALGPAPVRLGWASMPEGVFGLLSLAWTSLTAGVLLAVLLFGEGRAPLGWAARFAALLVLPAHLVWKPYFVFYLPLGVLVAGASARSRLRSRAGRWAWLLLAFGVMNLSGFNFVGDLWGSRLEAASSMLWAALAYLGIAEWDGLRAGGDQAPQLSS